MAKKILKTILFIMFLSGTAIASGENDTPKEEYITISISQLTEYKNQLAKTSEILDKTENHVILLEQKISKFEQEIKSLIQQLFIKMQQQRK